MLKTLKYFSDKQVVHADLKSENILISFDYEKQKLQEVKVIDFGSSFQFEDLEQSIRMTTPEYCAPEMLKMVI